MNRALQRHQNKLFNAQQREMRKAAKSLGLLGQNGDSVDGEVMRDMLSRSLLEQARADFNKRKRPSTNPPVEELEPAPPPPPVFRTAASAVVCQ